MSHQWWNLSAADQPPCTPVSHEFLLDIKEQLIAVFERDVWCRLRVFCIQIIYNDDGFKNRCERLEQTAKMTEQTTNNILIIQCLLHIIVLLVGHALAVVYVIMVSKGQRKRWSCLFKISSSHCEVPESHNKALHNSLTDDLTRNTDNKVKCIPFKSPAPPPLIFPPLSKWPQCHVCCYIIPRAKGDCWWNAAKLTVGFVHLMGFVESKKNIN